jgi:hypothetical protein
MDRQEVINKLKENHQVFVDYILSLSDNEFLQHQQGKWSAGQQLDHIYRSVSPVTMAFSLPDFLLGMFFGKPNRPGRSYDELVKKYKAKLEAGGAASGRFIPKPVAVSDRLDLAKSLIMKVGKLCFRLEKYSEEELDRLLLPHPLLGKLTLREMLYFTIYHAEHHLSITKRSLDMSA